MSYKTHLIIPDAHCYPEDNFRRFEWAGKLILEKMPDVIVQIGDWWDMSSLCSYDKGKRDFMFRSYREDIEAGHKGEKYLYGPIVEFNENQVKNKKKKYNPLIVKILGNHEYRVKRVLELEPRWDGTISMNDFTTKLPLPEVIVDFMDVIEIDGIHYSHYFVSGVKGLPASSARALLAKKLTSCTMGHTHTLDSAVGVRPNGSKVRSLICGSFHDKDHSSFAGPQVDAVWYNGLFLKHNVKDGDYDLEEWSIDRLEKHFS